MTKKKPELLKVEKENKRLRRLVKTMFDALCAAEYTLERWAPHDEPDYVEEGGRVHPGMKAENPSLDAVRKAMRAAANVMKGAP